MRNPVLDDELGATGSAVLDGSLVVAGLLVIVVVGCLLAGAFFG